MSPGHEGHAPEGALLGTLLPLAAVAVLAVAYLGLAARRSREPRGWNRWRTASFVAGAALLVLALVPQLAPFPAGDLRGHMHQHLLIGMYAPIALVLGAPVTLLLRSLPARQGQAVGRVLRSSAAHRIAHPLTAVTLTLGGLAVLYFTSLYDATMAHPGLHYLVLAHFFASGCLFAWVIAGPDPAPRRPSVRTRLVVLGIAIAGHAGLSQLLYAGVLVQVSATPGQLRGAADLMYYGGDIAELLLALALVTAWRPVRPRRLSSAPPSEPHLMEEVRCASCSPPP